MKEPFSNQLPSTMPRLVSRSEMNPPLQLTAVLLHTRGAPVLIEISSFYPVVLFRMQFENRL